MRAHTKSSFRLFKKHIARLITIIAIVIVSVGFMSGIGEVENKINIALNDYYASQNISDLYLKSKRMTGFTSDEISSIESMFGVEHTMKSMCYETKVDDDIVRVYMHNLDNMNINKLELIDGIYPVNPNEVLVERETKDYRGYNLGDTISINGIDYIVSGIVVNPLIINLAEESSYMYENEYIDSAIYMNSNSLYMVNDIYVTINNRNLFNAYTTIYKNKINELKTNITTTIGDDNISALSLYENFGLYSLNSYAEKVGLIGIVFVIFFMLVTLLVVYSTMSRLLDEERPQIACMKTLGYSNQRIVNKYLLFVFMATIIGGLLSFGVGLGLTQIIYSAFNLHYTMPSFPTSPNFIYYAITFIIIIASTLILTYFTSMKIVDKKPVKLLRPKTFKPGKKIMLERMPMIWNRLSFKYKSTLRNVFLFKSRFFMTVLSIIGSTVLIFAGLGLRDCSVNMVGGESLITISIALIVFSALLCALVIYNLTNINISERNREIATLMVLGYHDNEVSGYIFREIHIMSFIGAILGIPLGIGFIEFVFSLIDFGRLSDINWWTYILTPIITMVFSFLSTLLLRKKIVKTDMNASLKTIE